MRKEELKAVFDQQASGYDRQWARMAPIHDSLHFLLEAIFADLPADARILCVGAGTGVEIAYLARTFPQWRFTAVDPSGAMLDVGRQRAETEMWRYCRPNWSQPSLNQLALSHPFNSFSLA